MMKTSRKKLAEEVPYGDCDSADQSRGPLAFGTGGGPQAQRGCPDRYLLPSAPCACALVWPWSRGPAPGDSRWPSCAREGGGTAGGAWMLPLLQPGLTRASLHDDRLGQTSSRRCLPRISTACLGLSPSTPWRSMPSRLPGSTRIRRRLPCMAPTRMRPAQAQGLSRLGLRMGTAKMAMMILSRCS